MTLMAYRHGHCANGAPCDSKSIAQRMMRRSVAHLKCGAEQVSRHDLRHGSVALLETLEHGFALSVIDEQHDVDEFHLFQDLQAAIDLYQGWVRALS